MKEIVPIWISSGEQQRYEEKMQAEGMPPRPQPNLWAWSENVDQENLDLLALYGSLLHGQQAGMTDALDLGSAEAACRIFGDERPDTIQRLIRLHGMVREIERVKEKQAIGR